MAIDEQRLADRDLIPDPWFVELPVIAQLRREGVELWLVALNPEALEMVRRTPLAEKLGRARMRVNLEDAVDAYLERTT